MKGRIEAWVRAIIREELAAHDRKAATAARFERAHVDDTGIVTGHVTIVPSATGFGKTLNDGFQEGISIHGWRGGREWFKRWLG